MDPGLVAALLVLGVGAGIASTLLGIGGGLLMVPVLHFGLRLEWHLATAVSLAAIALQTPFGIYQHARRGVVDWRLGAWLALGGFGGTFAGTWVETWASVLALQLAFCLILLFAAWRLVSRPLAKRSGFNLVAVVAVGALAGVAAKVLGIGGGLLSVPALTLMGVSPHVAVASSLVAVFTNAAVATGINLGTWNVSWALPLALGAIAGNPLGAWIAHSLDERGLRRVVAVALACAAVWIAVAVAWV